MSTSIHEGLYIEIKEGIIFNIENMINRYLLHFLRKKA